MYKPGHDWMGKVIHGELCKKLNFDLTTEYHKRKQVSIRENEKHKIL